MKTDVDVTGVHQRAWIALTRLRVDIENSPACLSAKYAMLAPACFVKKAVLLGCAAGVAASALFAATLDVRIVSPVGSQRESDLLPGVVHASVTVTPDHGMPVSAVSDENGHVRLEVPPARARLRVRRALNHAALSPWFRPSVVLEPGPQLTSASGRSS